MEHWLPLEYYIFDEPFFALASFIQIIFFHFVNLFHSRHNIFLDGSALPTGITRRGALSAIRAVGQLNLSPRKLRDARLLCAGRSKATSVLHNRVIETYLAFLRKRGWPVNTMDERSIIEFYHHLESVKKCYSFVQQVQNITRKVFLKRNFLSH